MNKKIEELETLKEEYRLAIAANRQYAAEKERILSELRAFIDEESKFIPDITSDTLLDRLAKKLNDMEEQK